MLGPWSINWNKAWIIQFHLCVVCTLCRPIFKLWWICDINKRVIIDSCLVPVYVLARRKPRTPSHWPLARAAITHDSNEQSAEIPQNKIHPPKAGALTLSAWKNISVRDSGVIYPQSRNPLPFGLPLFSLSPLDKQTTKPELPSRRVGVTRI